MYSTPIDLFGIAVSIWNLLFLLAAVAAYPLWRQCLALRARAAPPPALVVRWVGVVYLGALSAQAFAYLVDLHTTLLPPPSVGWVRYYLDPLYGPKSLYGVILLLPLSAFLVARSAGLRCADVLDSLTPPLLAVLTACRVGCFLQGCCYGVHSDLFGLTFPAAGPVYSRQLAAGLIGPGDSPLPVIPTQLIEAAALAALCLWSWARLRRGSREIFVPAVAVYAVARFAIEWLRDDPERNAFGPLSTSQWVGVLVLVVLGARRLRQKVAQDRRARPTALAETV